MHAKDLTYTWVAADCLMISRCKNFVTDELRHFSVTNAITVEDLVLVDQLGHSVRSPLARFIIDQFSFDSICPESKSSFSTKEVELWPGHVTCALLNGILHVDRTPDPRDPATLPGCRYHEHENGEDCCLEDKKSCGSVNSASLSDLDKWGHDFD